MLTHEFALIDHGRYNPFGTSDAPVEVIPAELLFLRRRWKGKMDVTHSEEG